MHEFERRITMPSYTIWIVIAVTGMVLLGIGLMRYTRRVFEQTEAEGEGDGEGEDAKGPMAPLQKQAWWGLCIGLATTVVILIVFIDRGATNYMHDRGMRLLVLGIFFTGMTLYLVMLAVMRARYGRNGIVEDERDRMIKARAPAVQLIAVLVLLGLWSIALTETYWDRGEVPIVYPDLMFWSCFIVAILTNSVAILIGYRRM